VPRSLLVAAAAAVRARGERPRVSEPVDSNRRAAHAPVLNADVKFKTNADKLTGSRQLWHWVSCVRLLRRFSEYSAFVYAGKRFRVQRNGEVADGDFHAVGLRP
jgi:hypothetical protein